MRLLQQFFNITPKFKGKLRLARLLIPNKKNEIRFETPSGTKYFAPNLVETVSFELFVYGIYEEETILHICKSIPKNGVFIDVGANIGSISIEVAKRRPDINIYAFEAAPSVFHYLQENKLQNKLDNLNIFNLAVHETGGLSIPFFSPKQLNGKGSFAPVFTDEAVTVKTICLDEFCNQYNLNPNYIKIDVEGFELLILKSLKGLLTQRNNCILLFEFGDWAEKAAGFQIGHAQNYLLDLGYNLSVFPNNRRLESPILSGGEMILAFK
jgi:FkbM family methyltransferase